jgi:hypothetical protein
VLLFRQVLYMVSAVYQNQDNYDIIYATGADAGLSIQAAIHTSLLRVGCNVHGLSYQRIAHY